jgi:hypothetical protein
MQQITKLEYGVSLGVFMLTEDCSASGDTNEKSEELKPVRRIAWAPSCLVLHGDTHQAARAEVQQRSRPADPAKNVLKNRPGPALGTGGGRACLCGCMPACLV